jgi:alpha-L-rhamnosidase
MALILGESLSRLHIRATLSVNTAGIMNFQTASFYAKWLDDFADNQLEDGRVGDIIPSGGWGTGGCHPAWDSAYAIIAWDLYRYSGDTRILARHFDHIAAT